jgi:chromosome partitioning protein
MHVIVIASQKGGASKTTLAAHLAVQAEAAGFGPVALIDTDPQGTLTKWWQARAGDTPALVASTVSELAGHMPKMQASGFKLVIIDTPPAITSSIRAVIGHADLVILPVKPSPADLWAIGATIDLCRDAQRPFAFVVTQAIRGAGMTVQAVAVLSEHGIVSPAILHNRVGYAGALTTGQAIQELEPRGAGAAEVSELWGFVEKRINAPVKQRKDAKRGS